MAARLASGSQVLPHGCTRSPTASCTGCRYRNFGTHESLVVNQTVDADGQDHAGIRWYEVRDPRGAPFIHQQGTYAPDSDDRSVGSAAMDRVGNLAVGFTASGSARIPRSGTPGAWPPTRRAY